MPKTFEQFGYHAQKLFDLSGDQQLTSEQVALVTKLADYRLIGFTLHERTQTRMEEANHGRDGALPHEQ